MWRIALSFSIALSVFAQAPERIRVGGNVQSANLLKKVTPVYPALAKQARVQGQVRFTAIINKDGTMQNLQLVSGHPLLVPAATDAVKQWVYKPTLLNGNPVEVITQIDINFTLSEDVPWTVSSGFLSKFKLEGNDVDLKEAVRRQRIPAPYAATLAEDGTLRGSPIAEDHPAAQVAAIVLRWRYQPLTLDGRPFEPIVTYGPSKGRSLVEIEASNKVMSERFLARQQPVWPSVEFKGTVTVALVVGPDGSVTFAKASGAPELYLKAADAAVKTWRFRPVMINGEAYPVGSTFRLDY